jgi:aminoglycoside 3-N-acetyltransferase
MRNWHYSAHDIYHAIELLKLKTGDIVFIHSNIGFFGKCSSVKNVNELCMLFYMAIRDQIGDTGTICVPAFTYSYPCGIPFDRSAPTKMGAFSEWIRTHPLAYRSLDPCYSVAAVGADAKRLVTCVSRNSFDEGSFFERFYRKNGKVLNLNFDAGSTFIHYVERNLGVPYRFDKSFQGTTIDNGVEYPTTQTIWCRYMHPLLEARFEAFDKMARTQNVFKTAKLGRGEVGVISAKETHNLVKLALMVHPWFLTKAYEVGEVPGNYQELV